MTPAVTLICLSDRPQHLAVLLAALRVQTRIDWECLVLDQSEGGDVESLCSRISLDDWLEPGTRARRIHWRRVARRGDWGQAAKMAAVHAARGEWVGFPNDDAYYCPRYLELMLTKAIARQAELVYCDWISARDLVTPYQHYAGAPVTGHIDVGGFLVHRARLLAHGWPDTGPTGDGQLIESLVRQGTPHQRVPYALYVKN